MIGSVEIEGLRVSYGAHEVIRGVDLKLDPGAVTAIIGPSGCGKTTLLRCINRMSELSGASKIRGAIRLDGEDVRRMDAILLRRRIGMVFQRPNPFPMSIKENVLYGIKAQRRRGVDRAAVVEQSLRRAALWDEVSGRLEHSGLALSLGQQQRLCIARALAVSPEVVLMDEPAASLDPVSTAQLESSIVSMKGEYTVVIVTHDIREAEAVSDFTAFMLGGRIVEFGETKLLMSAPRERETQEYLAGTFAPQAPPDGHWPPGWIDETRAVAAL